MNNILKYLAPTDHAQRYITWILIAVFIGLTAALPGQFLSVTNWQSMAFQLPILGILAMAMAMAMSTGGINLAIIATTNTSAIITAALLKAGMPLAIAFGSAILVAVVIGFVIGFIVAYLRVSPILATLGVMMTLQGLNILLTDGGVISGFDPSVLAIGNGLVLGVPVPLIIFAVLAFIIWVLWEHTPLGRNMFYIGSNEEASAFSGINTRFTQLMVYVTSSVLCSFAGLIMLAKFNSAKAGYGESYLLTTILVAVLGGINPDGGFGRIFPLVLSLIVLQMLESGFNLLGVSPYLTSAIWGLVLVGYIALMRRHKG